MNWLIHLTLHLLADDGTVFAVRKYASYLGGDGRVIAWNTNPEKAIRFDQQAMAQTRDYYEDDARRAALDGILGFTENRG